MLKKSVSKVRALAKRLTKDIKLLDLRDPLIITLVLGFLLFPVAVALTSYKIAKLPDNDIRKATVMIGSLVMRGGGTGIVLSSGPKGSHILTNAHVCQIVSRSGVVQTSDTSYAVSVYRVSTLSDLCMITVLADLGVSTRISPDKPKRFEKATVSGHPALLPNVITEGHFSGRRIIQVVTGFKECTEKDLRGPLAPYCMFLGGIPVIRSFESVLVTATIMPGSSGSGVYDSNMDLVGVVFAGSGTLGYAWTVPYEQLIAFLEDELPYLPAQTSISEISLNPQDQESEKRHNYKGYIMEKCATEEGRKFKSFCELMRQDVISEE